MFAYRNTLHSVTGKAPPFDGVNIYDIIVSSKTREEHSNYVQTVLKGLEAACIKVKKEKWQFFQNSMGHKVIDLEYIPLEDKEEKPRL